MDQNELTRSRPGVFQDAGAAEPVADGRFDYVTRNTFSKKTVVESA